MGKGVAGQLPDGDRFTVAEILVVPANTPVTLLLIIPVTVGDGIVPIVGAEDVQLILLIVVPAGTVVTFAVTKAVCPTDIVGVGVERETAQVGQAPQSAVPPQPLGIGPHFPVQEYEGVQQLIYGQLALLQSLVQVS